MFSCALCLYLTGERKKSVTIANGQAVCQDHFEKIKKQVNNVGGPVALKFLAEA